MELPIVTSEDLKNLKEELLQEIKNLLSQNMGAPARKWLKSNEVRRLLTLSPGTLQNLRVNGTLPFSKINGVIFYDYDDILKMLNENRSNAPAPKKRKPLKTAKGPSQ